MRSAAGNRADDAQMQGPSQEVTATSSRFPLGAGHHIHDQNISGNARVLNGDIYNFILPDDIAKEAAGLSKVMNEAETACKALYELIGSAKNVPCDINLISRDLEDLHAILGTIGALLNDEGSKESIVWAALLDNLSSVVDSNLSVFADLTTRIQTLKPDDDSPTKTGKTGKTGKEPSRGDSTSNEVETLRRVLMSNKMTLNLAISMASYYQNNWAMNAIAEYRAELKIVLQLLEDEKAARIPPSQPHTCIDRAIVSEDRGLTLRRYFDDDGSLFSKTTLQPPPSMQVSTYLESLYFGTEQTFITARTHLALRKCTQVFIKGIPSIRNSITLRVSPVDTILTIKDEVRKRIELPNANFQLVYCGRVLNKTSATLERHKVLHDSTLICVSFRPDGYEPGAWSGPRICLVRIKDKSGVATDLHFDTGRDILVQDVKRRYAEEANHHTNTILIYDGKPLLEDDMPLTLERFTRSYGVCEFHVVDKLRVPDIPTMGLRSLRPFRRPRFWE
ncbi:uncharacterized protein BDR25DRAFT_76436 [Lindgomyces ingoldianus]|uniref:Uncharacterized protein n=1 Tax=Lindgomyces ingoldianus TaxID=673940 RepID=A0ACB6QI80_9PLEO|nr:uncharacterized protein BDR25DRAFT_76436 [Lindgomyces ingoldianus]KAF2466586.1 hypothetical protein BDR25DRAFT_76436 [Lindgomyces ingoldianus]